jgi:general stress protein 26
MKLPPLTDEELKPFLEEGLWVAKLATGNRDGAIRITPMTYAVDEGDIIFSTWKNSVGTSQRSPASSSAHFAATGR